MKPKRRCFRSVSFPEEAYVGYATVVRGRDIVLFYPLEPIVSTFEEYKWATKEFIREFSIPDLAVSDVGLLMPITFEKRIPLKPDYWQTPTASYTTVHRVKLFSSAANAHPLHKLLVTPSTLLGKRHTLAAAIPFFTSATTKDIEAFMYTSDFRVDETARDAALYMLDRPFGANWVTGQIIKHHDIATVWETH